jgi:hypothetical protein
VGGATTPARPPPAPPTAPRTSKPAACDYRRGHSRARGPPRRDRQRGPSILGWSPPTPSRSSTTRPAVYAEFGLAERRRLTKPSTLRKKWFRCCGVWFQRIGTCFWPTRSELRQRIPTDLPEVLRALIEEKFIDPYDRQNSAPHRVADLPVPLPAPASHGLRVGGQPGTSRLAWWGPRWRTVIAPAVLVAVDARHVRSTCWSEVPFRRVPVTAPQRDLRPASADPSSEPCWCGIQP